jgi:hypothetical protein
MSRKILKMFQVEKIRTFFARYSSIFAICWERINLRCTGSANLLLPWPQCEFPPDIWHMST